LVQCVCAGDQNDAIPEVQVAENVAKTFLRQLLERCANPPEHADEEDTKQYRLFLNFFVEDLLCLLHAPEWPASELLLKLMASFLGNQLLNQNASAGPALNKRGITFSIQALSLLGQLLGRIQTEIAWSKLHPLVLPSSRGETSATEKLVCPICDRGPSDEELGAGQDEPLGNSDRLVCSVCERCFHVACLNEPERSGTFSCDDCLMLKQLEAADSVYKYDDGIKIEDSSGAQQETTRYADLAAFRFLYLQYLTNHALRGSTAAQYAQEFTLAQWFNADAKLPNLCAVSHKTLLHQWLGRLTGHKREQYTRHDLSFRQGMSRFAAQAVVKHLAANSPSGLCTNEVSSVMLARLLCILGTGQATFRARAVKALGSVIKENPELMHNTRVQKSVENRVMDESISVREAAVELVGMYILAKPDLIADYQGMLVNRLSDLGLSVRKRVIRILRELLLTCRDGYNRTTIHSKLVERIDDPQEEENVRDLVVAIFRDLWFVSPGTNRPAEPSTTFTPGKPINATARTGDTPHSSTPCVRESAVCPPIRLLTPMQVVRSSSRVGSLQKEFVSPSMNKADFIKQNAQDIVKLVGALESSTWLVSLLKSCLTCDADASERVQKLADASKAMCVELVEHLVSELIRIQDENLVLTDENGDPLDVDIEQTTLQILETLDVFGEAESSLILPHLHTLVPYLKPGTLQIRPEDRTLVSCILLRNIGRVLQVGRSHAPSSIQGLELRRTLSGSFSETPLMQCWPR